MSKDILTSMNFIIKNLQTIFFFIIYLCRDIYVRGQRNMVSKNIENISGGRGDKAMVFLPFFFIITIRLVSFPSQKKLLINSNTIIPR